MKHILLIGLIGALVLVASVVVADEVNIDGLTFKDVSVVSGTDTEFTFESGGVTVRKAMDKVRFIRWVGHEEFNAAEKAFADGEYDKAIQLYDARLKLAVGTERLLILARKNCALTKLGKNGGTAASGPAPTAAAAATEKECPLCRNSGSVLCEACDHTGKGKCDQCRGKGQITCEVCQGNWRRDICPICKGEGTCDVRVPNQKHLDRVSCNNCNGRGYMFICPRCSGNYEKGKSKCSNCGGSGRDGVCSVCQGSKKASCKKCGAGSAAPSVFATPQAVSRTGTRTKPRTVTPDEDAPKIPAKAVGDPLSSPENLAAFVREATQDPREKPEWDSWNSIRQDEELKKYNEGTKDPEKTTKITGQKVTWKAKLQDATLVAETGNYTVSGLSSGGIKITATVAGSAKDTLAKLNKGSSYIVSGKIQTYDFRAGGSIFASGNGMGVTLEEATVSPSASRD